LLEVFDVFNFLTENRPLSCAKVRLRSNQFRFTLFYFYYGAWLVRYRRTDRRTNKTRTAAS